MCLVICGYIFSNSSHRFYFTQILTRDKYIFNICILLYPLSQAQPNADVLAVQPQDAADVPRDHRDAAGGPAPVVPGSLLFLQ